MRPIRTYLLIHSDQGWDTSVHRDFESLIDAWQPYSGKENFTGVIHVGLARPETDEFTHCISKYTGRMIMTASARWALLDVCQCAPVIAGEAKTIPLYIAVKGWGYDITSEEIGLIDEKDPVENIKESSKLNPILSRSVPGEVSPHLLQDYQATNLQSLSPVFVRRLHTRDRTLTATSIIYLSYFLFFIFIPNVQLF